LVDQSTGVTVATFSSIGQSYAAGIRVTSIVGADVSIIAGQFTRAQAGAFLAGISCGASITVIAAQIVVLVEAARGWVAKVRGAEIPVVAVERWTDNALSISTLFANRAGIVVIAKQAVVRRNHLTFSGERVADSSKARTDWFIAFDY